MENYHHEEQKYAQLKEKTKELQHTMEALDESFQYAIYKVHK